MGSIESAQRGRNLTNDEREYLARVAAMQQLALNGPNHNIEQDAGRFRKIIRRQVRDDLKKFISSDELIGRQGKDLVSIPIPQIDPPHFQYGNRRTGVGQGDGEKGDPLGPGRDGDGGEAGNEEGQHLHQVELTVDELAEMIEDLIELPNLLPLEGDELTEVKLRMKGITPNRSVRLAVKRAYLRALATGASPVKAMTMVDQRGIRRYRSFEKVPQPVTRAVIIYDRDISGSRSPEEAMLDRIMANWISLLVGRAYKNQVKELFVVHEARAYMVEKDEFFDLSASGGTVVSSAYELTLEIAHQFRDWNVFCIHFTDGENYDRADDQKCVKLLGELLQLPWVRMFGLSLNDIAKSHDEGLRSALFGAYPNENRKKQKTGRLTTVTVENRGDILNGIVGLLGKKSS